MNEIYGIIAALVIAAVFYYRQGFRRERLKSLELRSAKLKEQLVQVRKDVSNREKEYEKALDQFNRNKPNIDPRFIKRPGRSD